MSSESKKTPVVHIRNLKKSYGSQSVLRGLDLDVWSGEIFGFLGANGAGKTTTLEIIEGLRRPGSGTVEVFGLDVRQHIRKIRAHIGVSLQSTRYWGGLTVRETIELFRSFYRDTLSVAELAALFELEPYLRQPMSALSGGNYQRVALALAMANNPELLLLDEPTTGLDPAARRLLWSALRKLRQSGKTVILTTHYMEEAEALCDRIGIMKQGTMVQCGPTRELLSSVIHGVSLSFRCAAPAALRELQNEPWCRKAESPDPGILVAQCGNAQEGLRGLLAWAARMQYQISDIATHQPTLDALFLQIAVGQQEVAL